MNNMVTARGGGEASSKEVSGATLSGTRAPTKWLGVAQLSTRTAAQDPEKASEAPKRFPGKLARPAVAIAALTKGTIARVGTCVRVMGFGGAGARVSMIRQKVFAGGTDPDRGLDRISTVGPTLVTFQGKV